MNIQKDEKENKQFYQLSRQRCCDDNTYMADDSQSNQNLSYVHRMNGDSGTLMNGSVSDKETQGPHPDGTSLKSIRFECCIWRERECFHRSPSVSPSIRRSQRVHISGESPSIDVWERSTSIMDAIVTDIIPRLLNRDFSINTADQHRSTEIEQSRYWIDTLIRRRQCGCSSTDTLRQEKELDLWWTISIYIRCAVFKRITLR